jgi:hypothetical protein
LPKGIGRYSGKTATVQDGSGLPYAIVITKIQTNQFISSITISTIPSNKEESPLETEKNCFLWKVKIKKPLDEVTDVNDKTFENIPLTPTLQKILKHSPEADDAAIALLSLNKKIKKKKSSSPHNFYFTPYMPLEH